MSRADNLFATTLRLNLNNAADREAYDNLVSADNSLTEYGSYTKTIVTAVNDHFSRKDRLEDEQDWKADLLKEVADTVRETVKATMKELQLTATALVPEVPAMPVQMESPDETETTILNFLDAF